MKEPLRDEATKSRAEDGMPTGQSGYGMLHVASAEEVVKAERAAETKAAESMSPPENKLIGLEGYLWDIFEDARKWKEDETDIQATMIDCLMRKNGEYPPQKLKDLRAAGSSEAFLGLTGIKCRAIEAFIHDVYMNAKRKRTWALKPTPIVDLPKEDKDRIKAEVLAHFQESEKEVTPQDAYTMASEMRAKIITESYELASKKAENMSRLVHDQLIEGGWIKAMTEGILDLSTMKAMIIKGPILRERTVRTGWKDGKVNFAKKITPTFTRTSPLDLYPSRYSEDVDGAPLCEKINIDRSSLAENRTKPGYQTAAIEEILQSGPVAVTSSPMDQQREDAENRENPDSAPVSNPKTIGSTLRGIEYWTSCRGKDLIDQGVIVDGDGKAIDWILDYEINAITINKRIVYVDFNMDPLKRRPYSVTGFAKEIGSFWYKSPPELLKDPQDIVNAATRAMVNNLSWSSGPQIIVYDINKLPPG